MANENQPPIRARRWKPPPAAGKRSAPFRSNRFMIRLIGIPALAVAGVFIYSGIRDRLYLPDCDSHRARGTLSDVLKQFKFEPTSFGPIKTVSTTKQDVVCSAVLPLPDGTSVAVDFTFYWQDNDVRMKYSLARKTEQNSPSVEENPPSTEQNLPGAPTSK
jgi:hypothetical protein